MNRTIQENLNKPNELEKLYRKDSEQFKTRFNELYPSVEHTDIVNVWYERLNYREDMLSEFNRKDFIGAILIALLSGLSSRLVFYFIQEELINPINSIFTIMGFISIYFIVKNQLSKKLLFILLTLFGVVVWSVNSIQNPSSDVSILVYLHVPIFMWIVIGASYLSDEYRNNQKRLTFLRFNGEFIVLYTIMAISGIILTGITMQLFTMINLDISEFYFTNIVLIGVASVSILTTYLVDLNFNFVRNIAPLIAKLFGPLVLITLILFMMMVIITGQNPFIDREFLLVFNIVLFVVLAISLFSIIESSESKITNVVNCALISIALLIDIFALSSILFRLSSYGLTPNRCAVLGINLIIGIHLSRILYSYIKYFKNKVELNSIHKSITDYLPIYGIWSLIVIFAFPILF